MTNNRFLTLVAFGKRAATACAGGARQLRVISDRASRRSLIQRDCEPLALDEFSHRT